ncbi:MAG: hypothetical protein ACRDBQ_18560 [Shewanella sp.]
MLYTIHVTHTSMGVRVELPTFQFVNAIKAWAENTLHAPKMGKNHGRITLERGDAFYVYIEQRQSFIFHRCYTEQLLSIIKNVGVRFNYQYEIKEHYPKRSIPYQCSFDNYGFEMEVHDPESRFFYQNEVVETACTQNRLQTIFAIQTGRGKTKSFQKVMVRKKVRTGLIHRPTYVDKWIYDCCDDPTGLRIDRDKVLVCRGVDGIVEAYHRAEAGGLDEDDIQVVIFPTVSLQNFLREYSNGNGFGIDLERFYDVFGIGLVGYDEVHEHFLLVYLSGIMLNPPSVVEMSATLEPGENKVFIRDRYLERFPTDSRLSVPYIPVVDVRGFYYSLEDKKLAFWATKMTPYNHKLFEQKLMSTQLHYSYSEMWFNLIQRTYLDSYQPGQKVIILFATVDMCNFFAEYCRLKLQSLGILSELMVAKYNAGDSYDDFMTADIGVSTPSKAGTAIDKKGMIHMYCTTPIDDQQLNLQIAGRPRPVRAEFGWDINPKVWFGHCINIPKHGSYLNSRMKSLRNTVLSFQIANSPYVVRNENADTASTARARSSLPGAKFKGFSRKGPKGVSRRRRRSR